MCRLNPNHFFGCLKFESEICTRLSATTFGQGKRKCASALSQRKPAGLLPAGLRAPCYCVMVIALLAVLQHVLIVQVPVLPQLQGGQQHHEAAETRVPVSQQSIGGIAENVGRGDQP